MIAAQVTRSSTHVGQPVWPGGAAGRPGPPRGTPRWPARSTGRWRGSGRAALSAAACATGSGMAGVGNRALVAQRGAGAAVLRLAALADSESPRHMVGTRRTLPLRQLGSRGGRVRGAAGHPGESYGTATNAHRSSVPLGCRSGVGHGSAASERYADTRGPPAGLRRRGHARVRRSRCEVR